MRAIVFLMIAGMYMLLVAASASAEPINRFYDSSEFKSGFNYSCPINNFLISFDNHNGDNSYVHFPSASCRDAQVHEPKTVLAGMWILQAEDIAALHQAGKQYKDLLMPLFAGSLLIGISGIIKRLGKKRPLVHHEKAPEKSKASYEKTLWAESHGLM